jgi:hypothetical protein
MKCTYTSHDGRLSFEFDADSQKAIFAKLGMLQEVFEADTSCGCCSSTNIRFRVRHVESRDGRKCDYYELQCGDCNARLCFGQHQVGNTLFAKRKDQEGNPLPARGWSVYQQVSETAHEEYHSSNGQAGPRTPPPQRREPPHTLPPTPDLDRCLAGIRQSDTHERATAWKDCGLNIKGLDMSQRRQIEDAYLTGQRDCRAGDGAAR